MHVPVLLEEAINLLQVKEDGTYVDATVGCGGHAKGILNKLTSGKLICVDRDSEALARAKKMLADYGKSAVFVKGNFAHLEQIIKDLNVGAPDGILFDLGLSSLQLATRDRGFSFQEDGPLDMRMDPEAEGPTAETIVNSYSKQKLIKILTEYADERWAKRIATEIVKRRKSERFKTTFQLRDAVQSAIPKKAQYKMNIHPATRTFQAIRIEVNRELENLKKGLQAGYQILKTGGTEVVISYHSLEDRIVKNFFKQKESECICPPDLPECVCDKVKEMKTLTKKPITPTQEEIEKNPRSRSGKLRAATKLT